jgi:uncharacterized membrane protein
MKTNRLEAFSDGVIAIIITVMVLELKAPHDATLAALRPLLPEVLSYALSFVYLGIYWNNHHHMFQVSHRVSGGVLWSNLHLLFWLSLIPFTTAWAGENHFQAVPTALYGVVLLMSAIAYAILVRVLIGVHGHDSVLARAVGGDRKGWISIACNTAGIVLSFWRPWAGSTAYVIVALIWLIPDRRIENTVRGERPAPRSGELELTMPHAQGRNGSA